MKRVFKLPTTRKRISADVDAELRFHLDGRVEELMAREGLSREEAAREAERRFGDYNAYREQASAIDHGRARRQSAVEWFHSIVRELRTSLRSLRRSPAFSVISVITLALGLGAATTIFALLDRIVLQPLPYPNSDRLAYLSTVWPKIKADAEYRIARGQYFYFKQNSQLIEDIVLFDQNMTVLDGDGSQPPERISAIQTSANAFPLLHIRPIKGRPFGAADEVERQPRVTLISYEFWHRRFGADPGIIGRTIRVEDGYPLEIVGVLPRGAAMPGNITADIWYRNHLDPAIPPINEHTHYAVALMKPGVSASALQTELQNLQNRFAVLYPNVYAPTFAERTGFALRARLLRDQVIGATMARTLWLVFAAVAFVLLIAGANVANLFLMRADTRRREMALRRALGAGNMHIAIGSSSESVLLALAAGVLATGIGAALLKLVLAIAPQSLPRLAEVAFDWRSVAFCLGASLIFGIAFGLLPVASRTMDTTILRDGSPGLTRSRTRDRARRALVLAEVALAVVLLSGAGLMAKSFVRLRAVQPGFDPSGVHTMLIATPGSLRTAAKAERFWHDLTSRVEALPGVVRAGAGTTVPLAGGDGCTVLHFDVTNSAGESANCMPWDVVTPGYFEVLGMRVRGQLPTWESVEAHSAPVVVTRAFGQRFWETSDPVGHWVKPYNRTMSPFTVVGVADDLHFTSIQEPPSQRAFLPLLAASDTSQWGGGGGMTLVVKAPALSTGTIAAQVRSILADLEPRAVVADVTPMETMFARSIARTSFMMLLLLVAALIALILSAVGLYGAISYVVAQRRGEIGVRRALGAQVGDVTRLIVGQSLALATIGAAIGLLAALAGTRLLRTLLFDVNPTDPFILGGTVVMVLLVALVASAGPARRAAKIDPVEAMRV